MSKYFTHNNLLDRLLPCASTTTKPGQYFNNADIVTAPRNSRSALVRDMELHQHKREGDIPLFEVFVVRTVRQVVSRASQPSLHRQKQNTIFGPVEADKRSEIITICQIPAVSILGLIL